eukprot:COSAG01_NODE_3148_length_6514_cov_194.153079_2_plen_160_part_00
MTLVLLQYEQAKQNEDCYRTLAWAKWCMDIESILAPCAHEEEVDELDGAKNTRPICALLKKLLHVLFSMQMKVKVFNTAYLHVLEQDKVNHSLFPRSVESMLHDLTKEQSKQETLLKEFLEKQTMVERTLSEMQGKQRRLKKTVSRHILDSPRIPKTPS